MSMFSDSILGALFGAASTWNQQIQDEVKQEKLRKDREEAIKEWEYKLERELGLRSKYDKESALTQSEIRKQEKKYSADLEADMLNDPRLLEAENRKTKQRMAEIDRGNAVAYANLAERRKEREEQKAMNAKAGAVLGGLLQAAASGGRLTPEQQASAIGALTGYNMDIGSSMSLVGAAMPKEGKRDIREYTEEEMGKKTTKFAEITPSGVRVLPNIGGESQSDEFAKAQRRMDELMNQYRSKGLGPSDAKTQAMRQVMAEFPNLRSMMR